MRTETITIEHPEGQDILDKCLPVFHDSGVIDLLYEEDGDYAELRIDLKEEIKKELRRSDQEGLQNWRAILSDLVDLVDDYNATYPEREAERQANAEAKRRRGIDGMRQYMKAWGN